MTTNEPDQQPTDDRPASLVLRNGHIMTFDGWMPGQPVRTTSALAVRDGVIAACGEDETAPLIGAGTRVVDLDGRYVIPGINDAHIHLICYAMAQFGLVDVSYASIRSWDGLRTALTRHAVGPDGWLRAQGWDAVELGRAGSAADVDAALEANGLSGTPAVLFDRTGHQLLAGTAAMARLGITAATADPEGGVIVRDASGAPTGVFTDGATALILRDLPPVAADELCRVLRPAQAELARLGITSVTDPAIGPGHATIFDGSASPSALEALADMAAANELTVRTTVLLTFSGTGGESAESVREGLAGPLRHAFDGCDPRMLRIAGVKVFADGIQRSGTAWHREPYGPGHSHGRLAVAGRNDAERSATLRAIVEEIAQAGLQIGVHATGDAASDAAVDAFRTLSAAARKPGHYVIHGDFLPATGMPQLAAAAIGWSANPVISRMVSAIGRDLLGERRQAVRQPLASALRAGVVVTLASDAPVVAPDWREAVVAAVERSQIDGTRRDGDPEAVTSAEALAMLTVLPARQDGAQSWKGRLAKGYVADLAVLSGPWPNSAEVRDLLSTDVVMTVVDGRVVYDRM